LLFNLPPVIATASLGEVGSNPAATGCWIASSLRASQRRLAWAGLALKQLFACQEFWAAKRRCEKADLVRLKEFHEKHFGTVSGPETHMLSALISWILSPLSACHFCARADP
jgi:hypothetical protein